MDFLLVGRVSGTAGPTERVHFAHIVKSNRSSPEREDADREPYQQKRYHASTRLQVVNIDGLWQRAGHGK
ncbi:hypothetical protein GWI33_008622 [Rhynchophorus ferrugineus]|uniref:Uncharacterized protein n=1 Tax=Rhynchophorus ferrugineus TaxID=354439 RepID=A0A834ME10_RHYFE|nr:hypothetical protein GWI33_008622 [Rhynchophorus ferrugineus]